MKRNLRKVSLVIGVLVLGMTGCKKEVMNLIPATTSDVESQIQALAVQAENENAVAQILFTEATGEMVAVNGGVAPDYLVGSEDLTGAGKPNRPGMRSREEMVSMSFMRCLRGLKLDSTQVTELKSALDEYKDCRSSALSRADSIHSRLQAKYQALAAAQMKLFRDKTITRAELEKRLARLRMEFQKELRDLQIKDKVDAALKRCHIAFMKKLNTILTEDQWKAFVACHKK